MTSRSMNSNMNSGAPEKYGSPEKCDRKPEEGAETENRPEPFLLKPAGKDYLWGGNRLNDDFSKGIDMSPLAETWECSTHPDGPSTVASGIFAGKTLSEVLQEHPEYLGTHPAVPGTHPAAPGTHPAEPLPEGKIQSVAWATEEIVLAVPARFPINRTLAEYCYSFDELLKRSEPGGKKPPVPLRAFQEEPFLLLQKNNDLYQRGMELCRHAGFTPRPAVFLTQMMTAYYLVCEGQGISFLRSTIPEYVMPTDSVVFYQLEDPMAVRPIYLSRLNRTASPVQQKLFDFMWSHNLLDRPGAPAQPAGV